MPSLDINKLLRFSEKYKRHFHEASSLALPCLVPQNFNGYGNEGGDTVEYGLSAAEAPFIRGKYLQAPYMLGLFGVPSMTAGP